jgi:hypothetical protein
MVAEQGIGPQSRRQVDVVDVMVSAQVQPIVADIGHLKGSVGRKLASHADVPLLGVDVVSVPVCSR